MFVFVTSLEVQYRDFSFSASTFCHNNCINLCKTFYTRDMTARFKTIFPQEFFEKPVFLRGLLLAGVYLVLIISQLFTYEKFYDVIAGLGLGGGKIVTGVLIGLLPLLEVAALPFLLSMNIPMAARSISRIAVVAAPSLWLLLYAVAIMQGADGVGAGLLGATVHTTLSWWLVLAVAALTACAVIVARELPRRKT